MSWQQYQRGNGNGIWCRGWPSVCCMQWPVPNIHLTRGWTEKHFFISFQRAIEGKKYPTPCVSCWSFLWIFVLYLYLDDPNLTRICWPSMPCWPLCAVRESPSWPWGAWRRLLDSGLIRAEGCWGVGCWMPFDEIEPECTYCDFGSWKEYLLIEICLSGTDTSNLWDATQQYLLFEMVFEGTKLHAALGWRFNFFYLFGSQLVGSFMVMFHSFGVSNLIWLRLRHQDLQPDVMAYSAAISACEESSRWHRAIGFLKEMQRETWSYPKLWYMGPIKFQKRNWETCKSHWGWHNHFDLPPRQKYHGNPRAATIAWFSGSMFQGYMFSNFGRS